MRLEEFPVPGEYVRLVEAPEAAYDLMVGFVFKVLTRSAHTARLQSTATQISTGAVELLLFRTDARYFQAA